MDGEHHYCSVSVNVGDGVIHQVDYVFPRPPPLYEVALLLKTFPPIAKMSPKLDHIQLTKWLDQELIVTECSSSRSTWILDRTGKARIDYCQANPGPTPTTILLYHHGKCVKASFLFPFLSLGVLEVVLCDGQSPFWVSETQYAGRNPNDQLVFATQSVFKNLVRPLSVKPGEYILYTSNRPL